MPTESDAPFPAYFSFRHPLVRDLCWTLSPSFDLLAELPPYHRFAPSQPAALLQEWLEHLERHPQLLETFMADAPHRLGIHFERLVLFYLTHAPAQSLLVLDHNRPIYGRNPAGHPITIGELDFLLTTTDGTLHLETAVKFFLGVEHAGKVCWLGASLQDRLDRKIRHMKKHQLPLSRFLEMENEAPIRRCFWVKGILLQPMQENYPIAPGLLRQSEKNIWLTYSQAMALPEDHEWVCLPKLRWLGCGWEDLDEQVATKERIQQHFAYSNGVLMVSHRTSSARRIVVPDSWPDAAHAALEME